MVFEYYMDIFRDWLLNRLAVWCMRHCYNSMSCFYTACEQLTADEVRMQADMVIKDKLGKKYSR